MSDSGKPLTGRTVLIIFLTAFGIIISVNLVLMFAATGTFPGLVVKNSYVASQDFDIRRTAQIALGWTSEATYADGEITLRLTGTDGQPARPDALEAKIGRPTTDRNDKMLDLVDRDGKVWIAEQQLDPGKWRLEITATATDGTAFAQALVLLVPQP